MSTGFLHRCGLHLGAALMLAAGLAACHSDDSDGGGSAAPTPDDGCSESYPNRVDLEDANLAALITVCNSGAEEEEVTNVSPWLLTVQPDGGTAIQPGTAGSTSSLKGAATQILATSLNSSSNAQTYLPAGQSVIATSSTGSAFVYVGIDFVHAAQTWAVATMAGYVDARLARPGQAIAQQVAACAEEVGDSWATATAPDGTPLTNLLADTVLGPGVTCYPLFRSVTEEAGGAAPESRTLAQEFAELPSHLKSTLLSDLRQSAIDLVRVVVSR